MPKLRALTGDLPEPPYPASTSAGARPFHLDMVRAMMSDTWELCPVEGRAYALLSWALSWTQRPCGSLPGNLELVRRKLGCPRGLWRENQAEIMRGWRLHKDGRMYHPIVVEKVFQMFSERERWALQKSKRRQNRKTDGSENKDLQEMSGGSPSGVHMESSGVPLGLGFSVSKKKEKILNKKKEKFELPEGVDQDAWQTWCEYRNAAPWPWTSRAKTIAAGRLAGHDADTQRRAVDRAIEMGYRGVFPERMEETHEASRRVSRKSSAERVREATAKWYEEQMGSEPPEENGGPLA